MTAHPAPGAAHLHLMTKRRRVHNQPPRDDFIVHPELGVATVRTDHPDGTQVFGVQVAVPELRGLHLATGVTVTAAGGVFTTSTVPGTFPDLLAALTAVTHDLPAAPVATAA